jgi:hypothetical protein
LFENENQLILASEGGVDSLVHDLKFGVVGDVVGSLFPIKGLWKDSQANDVVLLIQKYFYLVPELIPHQIPTLHADVAMTVVLHRDVGFPAKWAPISDC